MTPVWGLWILLVLATVGTGLPCLFLGYAAYNDRRGGRPLVFPAIAPMLFLLPVWVLAGILSGLGMSVWGHGSTSTAGTVAAAAFAVLALIAGGSYLFYRARGRRLAARIGERQAPYPF